MRILCLEWKGSISLVAKRKFSLATKLDKLFYKNKIIC